MNRVLLAEENELDRESRREEDPADAVPESARHDQGAHGRIGEERDKERRVGRSRKTGNVEGPRERPQR
jgi:hypothetical protein